MDFPDIPPTERPICVFHWYGVRVPGSHFLVSNSQSDLSKFLEKADKHLGPPILRVRKNKKTDNDYLQVIRLSDVLCVVKEKNDSKCS